MILVVLGTQDKPFNRLLDSINQEIENGNIKEKIIVQAGYTHYESDKMEIFDLLDKESFDKYIQKCDILITHGGVGSILTGLKNNKKVIACPRLSKYKEHLNDHQLQIVEKFANDGYLLPYNDGDNLGKVIEKVKHFKPKKYIGNNKHLIKLISDFIDNN